MRNLRVLLEHIELLDDAVPHVGLTHPEDYAHEHIANERNEQDEEGGHDPSELLLAFLVPAMLENLPTRTNIHRGVASLYGLVSL